MNIVALVNHLCDVICGWPLLLYVGVISFIYIVALKGMQFTYLFTALKAAIMPSSTGAQEGGISPFQAFMNTINSNLGNGVIAGISTAIYSGGPGAAFWFVIFGFVLMGVRFAEVYLSSIYAARSVEKAVLGGPMLYLKNVFGGKYLPHMYAFFCLFYGLIGGNVIQANSIAISLSATWGVPVLVTGGVLLLFVIYILFGGAERIAKISLRIVPIKVVVFSLSALAILLFHIKSLIPAIYLIISSGLGLKAFAGGAAGFGLQQMIAAGLSRSIFATESGLGSAAIMFGTSGSNNPVQSGFMGMVSTFISTFIGFIVALCIVASGVWNTGLTSTALTIACYNTVFGAYGGWIVSFLAISFGFGVLVSYAYVVSSAWFYLTNNRYRNVFNVAYSVCVLLGSVVAVDFIWDLAGLIIAVMLFINMYGLLMLLPEVTQELPNQLRDYKA